MTQQNEPRRTQTVGDTAAEVIGGVARLGFNVLRLPLMALPRDSRQHMDNALRELSYAFASLPRWFTEIAYEPVDDWVRESGASPLGAPKTGAAAVAPTPPAAAAHAAAATPPPMGTATPTPPPAPTPPLSTATPPVAPTEAAPPAPAQTTGPASGVAITFVEYNPKGRDIDGEYVRIANTTGAPVSLTGWTLSDTAQNVYTFPNFILPPNGEVRLWTKSGKNNAQNLYWGRKVAAWNNEGDTATLRDVGGNIISRYTYTGKK